MDSDGTTHTSLPRTLLQPDNAIVVTLALFKLLIHLMTNLFGGYGYIRDELYYFACSDHMAWGYVDHPPFSIAALWLSRFILGDSLFAVRFLPAVSGALVVVLACLTARELGGKTFAQTLSGLCVIVAPLTLGMDSLFSMNSFDVFFWTLSFYLIVLVATRGGRQHWILLGMTLGLGLLNKISVLWLCAGLVAGLIASPGRRWFLTRDLWIAGAIAVLLFVPHLVWQYANGYPTLEFIRNAGSGKYVSLSPLEMLMQQTLYMNPLTLPVWFAGLIHFTVSSSRKELRVLPVAYLTVFLILVLNGNSKTAYLVTAFPMLFAMGAVTAEDFMAGFRARFLRPLMLGLLLASGIFLAPIAIAVLPVETFIAYSQWLGIAPSTSERNKLGRLPQYYADMFGWEEMVASVAGAYNTLSPEEKSECVIMCSNYGEAGAIDFFGRKYRLPAALCGHNNYWLWGRGNAGGRVVIRMGGQENALRASYGEVTLAGVFRNGYCMPYEDNLSLWVCRNRRTPLKDDWARFKIFN